MQSTFKQSNPLGDLSLLAVLEATTDAIAIIDSSERYVFLNAGVERMFGIDRKDILGRTILEGSLDSPDRGTYASYRQAQASGTPVTWTQYIPAHSKWIEIRLVPSGSHTIAYFRDVTGERRLTDRVGLKASILSQVNEAVLVFSNDETILFANESAERLYGVPVDQMIGAQNASIAVPSEGMMLSVEERSRKNEAAEPWTDNVIFTLKDGRKMPAEISASPHFDQDGTHVGRIVIVRDLTNEHALATATERYSHATSVITGMLAEVDLVTGHVSRSPGLYDLIGFTVEESEPTSEWWTSRVHPDDRHLVATHPDQGLSRGSSFATSQYRVMHKDGTYRIVWSRGIIIRNDQGAPIRIIGNSNNVTEFTQLQEALFLSEGRIRTALARSPVTVWAQDLDLKYTWLYNSNEGFDVTDIVGKSDYDTIIPEEVEQFVLAKKRVIATGIGTTYALRNLDEVGALRYFDLTMEPLRNAEGTIVGVTGTSVEVTGDRENQRERRRLASIVEKTRDMVIVVNLDSDVVYANPAASLILGIEPNSSPLHLSRIVNARQDDASATSIVHQALLNGAWYGTLTLTDATGTPIDVQLDAFRIDDPATGKALNCALVARDITEQNAIQHALHQSENRYRATFENAAVGIAHVSVSGAFARVNQSFAEITGRTAEELSLLTFQNITHPPDLEADLDLATKLYRGEIDTYSMEKRYIRPDGNLVWVLLTASAMRDDHGQLEYFIAIIQDITDRKHAVDALGVSQERLHLALTAAGIGAWEWNVKDNSVVWTGDFENVLGYESGYFGGTLDHFFELVHVDDRASVRERLRDVVATSDPWSVAFRMIRADGSFAYVETLGRLIFDDAGQPSRLIGVNLDATQRHLAEQDRREMIEGLAHDLKTPLTTLRAQAQLLRRRLGRGPVELLVADDALATVDALGVRITVMIDEMLDAAHLRAGDTIDLHCIETDIAQLTELTTSSLQRTTNRHTITLQRPTTPVMAEVDQPRIERVLSNIISNAIKFSPNGGDISVNLTRSGTDILITVTDHGVGIPAGDLDHIFRYRHRGRNVRGIAGTGIGLAGAHSIIGQHGGSVSVASTEGKGSTFTIRLPAQSEACD